ncbi:MAG TPA: hypothetical protein VL461_06085 [Dictyobacter sp.]|jgi:uncharacterized membrane protein|nr:hypothetical protein [Dictyobacter sp.]
MWEILWLVRFVHILSATAWIGGCIMYQFVLIPALRVYAPAPELMGQIASYFRRLSQFCIALLILSGVYLMFSRLTQTTLGLPYLAVLGIKILVVLGMFVLEIYLGQNYIRKLAKRTTRLSKMAPQLLLVLGIFVFLLGALLNTLFEQSIAPH